MKNKKRTMILVIIALIAVVGILVGTTYAYFTASVTNATAVNENVITTGTMALEFTDGPEVKLENAAPGSQVEKTFKVKNIGTVSTKYDVYFSELINRFADKTDLVYTLESSDGGYNTTSEVQVPSAPSKMVDQQSIGVNETHTYKLTVKFKETNDNQNDNANKKFSSKIDINKYSGPLMTMFDNGQNINQLMKKLSSGNETSLWTSDDLITSIERSTTLDNTDNEVSVDGGLLYIWYDNGIIKYYTDAQNIYLNPNCYGMFNGLKNLSNLDLSNFDASRVTYMYYMFENSKITGTINFGENFNTSNVTNMYGAFYRTDVNELDLSDWDISSLEEFSDFISSATINKINISNWNFTHYAEKKGNNSSYNPLKVIFGEQWSTNINEIIARNVTIAHTSIASAFYASKAKKIDISGINMINGIENASKAFYNCSNLEEIIGLTDLNTEQTTNMEWMFNNCPKITVLDLSSFNTSNVTNMNNMFSYSNKLTTIYVDSSKWSIASVIATYGTNMFSGANSLVGGSGTTYDSSHCNEDYARVDDPDNGKPGYFTTKNS